MPGPEDVPAQTSHTAPELRKPLEESMASDEPTDLTDSSQVPNPESRGGGVDPKLARRIAKATFHIMQEAATALEADNTHIERDPPAQHDGTPPNDENAL